ncbi:PE family protein [Labilithrix luteola]|uniref:PE family protein n=1 Tax=Labilithrix luteola TaxID=1391654 RepID=A0A0K1PU61_9BACT|nr:hypothetical protein [Labilithrix luteola]AKU96901.1 PE family protein [Labilithrix luteola]
MLTYLDTDTNTDGLAGAGPGGAGGTSNAHPQDGAAGADGKKGSNGSELSYVLTEDGVTVGNGTKGSDGEPGKGGGGDVGVEASLPNLTAGRVRGFGGGGGGAGGCPGLAGGAGGGGGASIALAAYLSPVRIDASQIVTSTGGKGGQGTTPSAPTLGGIGGIVSGGFTNRGGHGGAGGHGGISGHGAGGPSFGIGWVGTEPVVTDTTYQLGVGGAGAPAKTQGGATIPASPNGESAEKKLLVVPA